MILLEQLGQPFCDETAVKHFFAWLIDLPAESVHLFYFIQKKLLRFLHRDCGEADLVVRLSLDKLWDIYRDHSGDLCVSSRCLTIGQQDNRFPVAWHLDGAEGDAVGNDIRCSLICDDRPFQTAAHAVKITCDDIFRVEEGLLPCICKY